jgi:hypothetical protein
MNIIHPLTNEVYDIHSEEGLNLLKKYVNTLMTGGSKKSKKNSSKPGGNPKGRGGKGKTRGKHTQSKYSSNTHKSRTSRQTTKVQMQNAKNAKLHLQKIRLKKKLIDNELNELSETYPVVGQLINNFDIIVNQAIYNPSAIKELQKTMKEDTKYFSQMFDSTLNLSSYTAVGNIKQSTFAFQGLTNNLKKHSWWEKFLFALLFLSVFRANYTLIASPSTELVESNQFLTFGSEAFSFYQEIWKQREKADIDLMTSRRDLADTTEGQRSVSRGYRTLAKTIQPYLKKIIPETILEKIAQGGRKFADPNERGLYLNGLLYTLIVALVYVLGLYNVSTNNYLI